MREQDPSAPDATVLEQVGWVADDISWPRGMSLSPSERHLIVANERGAEQGILPKLERRGAVVVKLLDNTVVGRDDRQFIVLPPGHAPLTGVPLAEDADRVFPNVPYEEKKGVRRV